MGIADVRRYGRRGADKFFIYRLREDPTYRHVGQHMVWEIGLLEQSEHDLLSKGEVRFSDNMVSRDDLGRTVER